MAKIANKRFKSGTSLKLLDGVALNATAATRTVTLDLTAGDSSSVGAFQKVEFFVEYTYSAATTVTAQATRSIDEGVSYMRRTSRSTIQGTSTVFLQTDTYTTGGASANFSLEYDVAGLTNLKVLFGGASADGSDLVTVKAVGIAG